MLPLRDLGERLAHALQRAGEAVAVLVLHFLHLVDDVVGALLEARVAGRGLHQADRRQIMPGDVAGELPAVAVPAGVARRLRLEPGALAVERQHAIRLEREQVGGVEILRVLERPAGQPHRRQRQRRATSGFAIVIRCTNPDDTSQVEPPMTS